MEKEILYKDLCYAIVGCAMEVHRELGHGFLEKVYENALAVLLGEKGVMFEQQRHVEVRFRGKAIGTYCADILVEECIILELKAGERLTNVHRAQALNYLKATGMKLALLLNFGKRELEYERVIL